MIVFNLFLDIKITNMTVFYPFFFLTNIFKIPYKHYYFLAFVTLFIDIFIIHLFPLTFLVVSILYFVEKRYFKRDNLILNIFLNSVNYFIYLIILKSLNISVITLQFILLSYTVNLVYYFISYIFLKKSYN